MIEATPTSSPASCNPVKTTTPPKSKTKPSMKVKPPNAHSSKTFSNICLLCMKSINALPDAPLDAWKASLCNVKGNSANAEKHLKYKHANDPEAMDYFCKKEEKKKREQANCLTNSPNSIAGQFCKSRCTILCEKMVDWLITCGIPHEVTQSSEFIDIFRVFDKNATAVSLETYLDGFDKRINTVSFIMLFHFIFSSFINLILNLHGNIFR